MEILSTRLEEGDPDYALSRTSLDIIAKMSYTAAQEVEFYGVTAYQLLQLTSALQDAADDIAKV